MNNLSLLDCTLRDGAYVIDGEFGSHVIGGIINRLQEAKVDFIECGWLKDEKHKKGTTFFHVPSDLEQYLLVPKSIYSTYVAMIDYNRYNLDNLPDCDGKSIDAIRIVFPKDKIEEGVELVDKIIEKGYKVCLQAANTYGYTDNELLKLIEIVNKKDVISLSIVDTFGAMYEGDLIHILSVIDKNLRNDIGIGFHSHNNRQLSFSLSMKFIEQVMKYGNRHCIIDSSLVGMGRGAGNTPTEMIVGYMNRFQHKDYNENIIIDSIDVYMQQFIEKYNWGYSVPYMISGTFGCHVNNIKYLRDTHRASGKDMKLVFERMTPEQRTKYDYNLLEKMYSEYQEMKVNDEDTFNILKDEFSNKRVVTIAPGRTVYDNRDQIIEFVKKENCVVIGVNSVVEGYEYNWLFFENKIKYRIAKEINPRAFDNTKVIITSNCGINLEKYEISYEKLIKRGWKYYENSQIMLLRLLRMIDVEEVFLAGFDGFTLSKENNYADEILENGLDDEQMIVLHNDVRDMFRDFVCNNRKYMKINFITESAFQDILNEV